MLHLIYFLYNVFSRFVSPPFKYDNNKLWSFFLVISFHAFKSKILNGMRGEMWKSAIYGLPFWKYVSNYIAHPNRPLFTVQRETKANKSLKTYLSVTHKYETVDSCVISSSFSCVYFFFLGGKVCFSGIYTPCHLLSVVLALQSNTAQFM